MQFGGVRNRYLTWEMRAFSGRRRREKYLPLILHTILGVLPRCQLFHNHRETSSTLSCHMTWVIGYLSKKVLDFGTRNRRCRACDFEVSKEMHYCRLNFVGSAKAMEANLGTQLVKHSTVLKESDLQVTIVIGDEDSNTIAAIRRTFSLQIFKFADTNHLKKNLQTIYTS